MLRPIVFFREKLNGAKLKYSTYDLEFYANSAVYKELELLSCFNINHEALKFNNSQYHLNKRHAK